MKITRELGSTTAMETQHPIASQNQRLPLQLDLSNKPPFPRKPPRRKTRTRGAGFRLRREASDRGSRPETPLLRWKFDETDEGKKNSAKEEQQSNAVDRKSGRHLRSIASARKLGAGLWRLLLPKFQANCGSRRLWLQPEGVHLGTPNRNRGVDRKHGPSANNLVHNPLYVSPAKAMLQHKFEPSFQFLNPAMEGATKWDPSSGKTSDELNHIFGQRKLLKELASDAPVISALERQLEQAKARITELETERISLKKKVEQFVRKVNQERADWRSREHEKVRAILDDMKAKLNREKKHCQKLEMVNSRLVNELADAKISVKRALQGYEKERKDRELIEKVCDELAKEIGEDKAEAETLKRESRKLWEEVEEERKMLQMAEVWREERVQMKLVDAKVMLEDKYSQMNRLLADLDTFLNNKGKSSDLDEVKKAEFLWEVAASINIQDIRDLKYEPPNLDDMFEDINFGESNEREIDPDAGCSTASCDSEIHKVTPEVKLLNKDRADRCSSMYMDHSGELEEDASEWETVSQPEDHASSYSPDESVSKSFRVSNVSREWERIGGEETPTREINEASPVQPRQVKKASSISRLWRSCPSNGENYKIVSIDGLNQRLSNGRLSNGAIISPDCESEKDEHSSEDLGRQWSLLVSGTRGMRGCMEWTRSAQKHNLKGRLLEARNDSKKIQLRQVLKQKI